MSLKRSLGAWVVRRWHVDPELLFKLRFEAASRWSGLRNRLNPAYHRTLRRLRGERGLSLNVGSGGADSPAGSTPTPSATRRTRPFPATCAGGFP